MLKPFSNIFPWKFQHNVFMFHFSIFLTSLALTKIISPDFSVEGNWMSKCQSCRQDSLQYTDFELSTIADRALSWGNMMYGNCCIFPESFFQGNTVWACAKQRATEQRWIEFLRLGPSLLHGPLNPLNQSRGRHSPRWECPQGTPHLSTAAPTTQISSVLPLIISIRKKC